MAYIGQHKTRFGVEPICRAPTAEGIAVAPSGYYATRSTPLSRRALSKAGLGETIEATFWDRDKDRGVYGVSKMPAQLRRDGITGMAREPIALHRRAGSCACSGSEGSAAASPPTPPGRIGSLSGPRT